MKSVHVQCLGATKDSRPSPRSLVATTAISDPYLERGSNQHFTISRFGERFGLQRMESSSWMHLWMGRRHWGRWAFNRPSPSARKWTPLVAPFTDYHRELYRSECSLPRLRRGGLFLSIPVWRAGVFRRSRSALAKTPMHRQWQPFEGCPLNAGSHPKRSS